MENKSDEGGEGTNEEGARSGNESMKSSEGREEVGAVERGGRLTNQTESIDIL